MGKVFRILLILLLLSILLLLTVSCDIQKSATKNKSESSLSDNVETKLFRKGDSVSYRPVINNPIYKDTTIYRVTKNNTRLETVYDSKGNIRDINCYTDKIEELTKRNMQLEQSDKNKESEKVEKFDDRWILYIMGAIMIVAIIALILFFIYMQKNSAIFNKSILSILQKQFGDTQS